MFTSGNWALSLTPSGSQPNAESVFKYWSNWILCNQMYKASAVASVGRLESLVGTICGSVVVQRDGADMYMAIVSMIHSS